MTFLSIVKNNLVVLFLLSATIALSQDVKFPFQNTDLSPEQRVDDLLIRLTLEEKVSQMQDVSPAIYRLGIEEYNWWNECLHGVARAGRATSFPQAIGMAATWNTSLINEVADAISTEARAKFNSNIKKGQRNRYQGLTMWTPNINIFRDPRWGRGQETYGEDPYLTSRMGVAFIKGLQGNDTEYLKVIATPKHYAVHSGPEYNRHSFDAHTTKKDLWETYLPAFEAAIVEAKAYSIMSAYNRYLGESATASKLLLTDILRDKWGFKGYVVSDCGAVSDIYRYHNIVETVEEASALAVKNGCDLNCGDSYSSLLAAISLELITEEEIGVALRRLLLARVKLGLFNQLEDIPFKNIGEDALESDQNRKLALQTAKESIVLLKNKDNILPLSKDVKTVTIIGPNANDRHFLLGNYFGVPSESTTVFEGLKNKLSKETELHYFKGVNIADDKEVFDVVDAELFMGDIKAEYFDNSDFKGDAIAIESDELIDFEWGGAAPIPNLKPGNFAIRYSGNIKANYNGEVSLAVMETGGSYKLFVDGKLFIEGTSATEHHLKPRKIKLEKGKEYNIRVDYSCTNEWMASIQLIWNQEAMMGKKHMMDVVNKSDVVVFVGGITARLEGEEMPVAVEGFYKGDRTNLKLPKAQHELLRELKATGKPVVFVVTTGSALSINWEQDNLDAILSTWYPGQAGGEAIADVLLGNYNPSGRLPVTFYKSVDDVPDFEDYSMQGRTYRYFKGETLYSFGFGLSYTKFYYTQPVLQKTKMNKEESNVVSVKIENIGDYDGETVVQLYIKDLKASVATPLKSLRGFKKVFVKRGESVVVEFELTTDDLSIVNDDGELILEAGKFEIYVGENSETSNKVELEVE